MTPSGGPTPNSQSTVALLAPVVLLASGNKLTEETGSGTPSVIGSGNLAQSLMEHGLADGYRLWIHLVVLGSGKRLFADGIGPLHLRLVDTKRYRLTPNTKLAVLPDTDHIGILVQYAERAAG